MTAQTDCTAATHQSCRCQEVVLLTDMWASFHIKHTEEHCLIVTTTAVRMCYPCYKGWKDKMCLSLLHYTFYSLSPLHSTSVVWHHSILGWAFGGHTLPSPFKWGWSWRGNRSQWGNKLNQTHTRMSLFKLKAASPFIYWLVLFFIVLFWELIIKVWTSVTP